MKIFDTHAHLGLLSDDKIETLVTVKSAYMHGVSKFVNIANSILDFDKAYNMLKNEDKVYFAVGISPSEAEHIPKGWEMEVQTRAKLPKVIAIGETGLDYYKQFGNKSSQVDLFISHIKLSNDLKKPLIIHNREASNDIFEILKSKNPTQNMVYHCYSDGFDFAMKSINQFENLYISFSGNITYKNPKTLYECVRELPFERMVIESESPFMASLAHKGLRNKPEYITDVLTFISKTRNIDKDELASILWQNSNRLFGFNDEVVPPQA